MAKVECSWSTGEEVATYPSHQVDFQLSPAETIESKYQSRAPWLNNGKPTLKDCKSVGSGDSVPVQTLGPLSSECLSPVGNNRGLFSETAILSSYPSPIPVPVAAAAVMSELPIAPSAPLSPPLAPPALNNPLNLPFSLLSSSRLACNTATFRSELLSHSAILCSSSVT